MKDQNKVNCEDNIPNKHLSNYKIWFVNCHGINRLELLWLESFELLETLVPGPGFRRGAAENRRRFKAIN